MKQGSPPGDLERAAAIATWRNTLPQGRGTNDRPSIDSPLHRSAWSGPATTTVEFVNAQFADVRPPLDADRIRDDRAA